METRRSVSTTNSLQKLITSSSLVIFDGNVVKAYTNPEVEFCDDAANENAEAICDMIGKGPVYYLFVPDPTTHITLEARLYEHPQFESLKIGQAIVIKTLAHRLLAQFYLNVRKNKYPVKIFDCETSAMNWFDELNVSGTTSVS